MASIKPVLRAIIFTAIILVITLIVIDIINSSMKLNFNIVGAGRGGGGCSGFVPLYDSLGYAHGPNESRYIGPAPLYVLDDSITGWKYPECKYPKYIDPSIVNNTGISLYPVHISLSVSSNWIRVGESTKLTAIVSIDTQFGPSPGISEDKIFWTAEKEGEITFIIEAPNFDTGPSNERSPKLKLAIGKPAKGQWIIAPKERAAGRQLIGIYIQDLGSESVPSGTNLVEYIEIEIRPTIGVDPVVATWATCIGAFILWTINIIKVFQEIREKKYASQYTVQQKSGSLPESEAISKLRKKLPRKQSSCSPRRR